MPTDPTLLLRIELAEEICGYTSSLVAEANAGLRHQGVTLDYRNRVLVGLVLKIESSFRALIEDCKAERVEAMHHLKTMAECMIYFYVALRDPSGQMARRLVAKAFTDEIRFYKDNPDLLSPATIAEIEVIRDELLSGQPPLPNLRDIAATPGVDVSSWYSRVYRLACEPAHVGDLVEFMPEEGAEIRFGSHAEYAASRALSAIWFGSQISLAIMRAVCEESIVPLRAPVEELERRLHRTTQTGTHVDTPPTA